MGFDVGTKIAAAVQFLTSSGKPARVDGVPEWSVDDQNIVSDFAVASDGMSVTFTCATSGSTAVRVKADADLGSGVREVNGVGTLTVNEEEAATAEIVFTAVP